MWCFFSFKTLIGFSRRQFVKMILISVRSIGVDTVSNGRRVVIFSEGLELLSQSVMQSLLCSTDVKNRFQPFMTKDK